MDTFTITAQKRVPAAKSALRKLKKQGYVPGILYDENQNIPLSIQESEITHWIAKQGESVPLNLNYEGKAVTVRVQQIQRDPVSQDITHIDLMPVPNTYLQ